MSYFRPQQAGKIGPRTVHCFSDSTSQLSKNAGQVIFAGLMFFVVSLARANSAPDAAADSATFRAKCVMCHGPDGGGSEVGKTMHVPDLRSPDVQNLPDAQLAQIISDGKGGMPPFKNSLSQDQVYSLVAYIRSLRAKK